MRSRFEPFSVSPHRDFADAAVLGNLAVAQALRPRMFQCCSNGTLLVPIAPPYSVGLIDPVTQWLERPCSLSVAPDGSAAVLAVSQSGEVSVNTYSPTGDPRATFVGPPGWSQFGCVAYDGRSAFFRNENELYVISPDNRCVGSFRLPFDAAKNVWEGPFVAVGATQLWFVDREGLTLDKFAIPHLDQPSEIKPHHEMTPKS